MALSRAEPFASLSRFARRRRVYPHTAGLHRRLIDAELALARAVDELS